MIILTIIVCITLSLLVYCSHKNYVKRLDKIEQALKEKNEK
jgi:Tfp pilus assembly protein PilE